MTQVNHDIGQVGGGAPFHADEPVLQNFPLIVEAPIPAFGDTQTWALDALGWNPNSGPGMNRIHFTSFDRTWNQIARRVAMAMLNPTHQALRRLGVFRTSTPHRPKTVRMTIDALATLAACAATTGRCAVLSTWAQSDLDEYLRWLKANRRPSTQRLGIELSPR